MHSQNPQVIVFDFDGVLCESVDVKTAAFRELFSNEDHHLRAQIVEYHIQNGGISRFEKFKVIYRDILHRPLSQEHFEFLCQEFARLVVEGVVASPWVPGALEFLEKNQKKYRYFIVSATPDPEIKDIANRKQISSKFGEILGSPQPKEVLLKLLLEKYRLGPEAMVYVGDAQNDWQAARDLSIPFIWRSLTAEIESWPGYQGPRISSLNELDEALAQL